MESDKENISQALVIMDLFNNNFDPISNNKPMALISIAGIPLIDYVLESLACGGVNETYLFCCRDVQKIKDYIKKRKDEKVPWSLMMEVLIISSDTCQTMGDCMREIDAAGILRGYFVLLGVNTITNINFTALLEQHMLTCKKDKGAAMSLLYNEVSWKHPLIMHNNSTMLAVDGSSKKILMHKKYKPKSTEAAIMLPLDCVLQHSEVKLNHNLVDAGIAFCSPSVLPLFSDNFDFQTMNDFIHGILINEDILASSLYCTLLKENQYAAVVTNWKTYQTVCWDIIHNWTYPLSIETGSFYRNSYMYMGNYNFRKVDSTLSRSCTISNVVIGANTSISDCTEITNSVIGNKCTIGSNVTIKGCNIMDNVVIKNNCHILNSFIDDDCTIEENSNVQGVIAVTKVCIKENSQLKGAILGNSDIENNDKARVKSTSESGTEWENESSIDGEDEFIGFDKEWSDSESCYSSDSSPETSVPESPVAEDTNIFLQEVIDSLARGYEEKLKCDYLILEINSSRYAYNIQLHEVNFFVIRAILSMPVLTTNKNVLSIVKDLLKFFRPVLSNYIKTKSSIMDCLRAIEDSCIKNEWFDGKAGQVLHLFYEIDVVDEDSLVEWHKELIENESLIANQTSLVKFFDWLNEASEESENSE